MHDPIRYKEFIQKLNDRFEVTLEDIHDPCDSIRVVAIENYKGNVSDLKDSLDDPNDLVRAAAFVRLKDVFSITDILRYIDDKCSSIRIMVLFCLFDNRKLKEIQCFLKDSDISVRSNAEELLAASKV